MVSTLRRINSDLGGQCHSILELVRIAEAQKFPMLQRSVTRLVGIRIRLKLKGPPFDTC